ncbi:hypothetical protein ACU4GI_45960 [Cupriavidus basilensis]
MQCVKIENGQPVGDLIDRTSLGHMLPKGISFPLEMSAELLAEYGFVPAQAMPQPTVGPLESARLSGYKLVDGIYYQTWAVDRVASLGAAQAITIAAIEALAKSKRDAVVADYSPAEMSAWSMKRAEALAFGASQDAAAAPALVMEAQVRGIPLNELVDKVLAKAAALSQLEAGIAGTCGKKQDAVRACDSVQEIQRLVEEIEEDWPM